MIYYIIISYLLTPALVIYEFKNHDPSLDWIYEQHQDKIKVVVIVLTILSPIYFPIGLIYFILTRFKT